MGTASAPLLSDELVSHARAIAESIRKGEVAALVGNGLSIPRGLPTWTELIDRLILAWREWDPSRAMRQLAPDNYIRLLRRQFPTDQALASYLRHCVDETDDLSFGQLLYSSLYYLEGKEFTPEPSDIHRHLVRLMQSAPARIWTTNYDDLLEEAARSPGLPTATIDPSRRGARPGLSVAHLHGFLAPPSRTMDHPEPSVAEPTLALAEDDFHVIAGDSVGWTNREFHRLFDEHRVLILGMSMDDPNVRRVLATSVPGNPATPKSAPRKPVTPSHFALLTQRSVGRDDLHRIHLETVQRYGNHINTIRVDYWRRYAVDVVTLPNHEAILSFLVRLRYESFGSAPGDLWIEGARRGWEMVQPWGADQQERGRSLLSRAKEALAADFSVPPGEIVEMGLFLLRPGEPKLELVFRAGGTKVAVQGEVLFSADPDRPTGAAGRVFVSGAGVRIGRTDPLHDFGLASGDRQSSGSYAGIICVPLVDWKADGVPVGVIYATTSSVDGTLFRLPLVVGQDPSLPSVDALYTWLHLFGLGMLDELRSP